MSSVKKKKQQPLNKNWSTFCMSSFQTEAGGCCDTMAHFEKWETMMYSIVLP